MYKMPDFTEHDTQVVLEFMKANPFVTLIGNNGSTSVATQIPVLVEEKGDKLILRGHIMRKTDHHLAFEKNPEALVLFTGPHCYVSSSWYAERNVGSTWNYMTVHARGAVKFLDNDGTTQIIDDLTHKYESDQKQPELVQHMPADYISQMVKAIAGFEIEVESIYPLFKLSQNRSDVSYKSIVTHLLDTACHDEQQIANEMVQRRANLFEL
ncbi:FMN-binding negative transcriptional regulator [Polluticoccus soli]|uniref:FMN-binding negative transcriptional regulator n=1 Tax=Polluticoccus soli TaxID=3034150 RepID=UPI0023E2E0F0|nr:FMN-binding negative transcriptional regulator [Flavipsychrobacter sp. JY13-12]